MRAVDIYGICTRLIGNSNFYKFESNKLLTEMLVFLLFKKESESDYMLTIETKELEISKDLLKKVETICKFACVKPTITNRNIKNIKGTNIAYVKPHIININNIDYLIFDECDDIFINGYDEKIKFKDFETYIKSHF